MDSPEPLSANPLPGNQRLRISLVLGIAVIVPVLVYWFGNDLVRIAGGSRPPNAFVDEAARHFGKDFHDDSGAYSKEVTSHKIRNVANDRIGERNVVIYEVDATITHHKFHKFQPDAPDTATTGRLTFWREGGRWFCRNPDAFLGGGTLSWRDQ